MGGMYQVHKAINGWCAESGYKQAMLRNTPDAKAIIIECALTTVSQIVRPIAAQYGVGSVCLQHPQGTAVILSQRALRPGEVSALLKKPLALSERLEVALTQDWSPDTLPILEVKAAARRDFSQSLQEALNGIATPTGQQPQEGLDSLMRAMQEPTDVGTLRDALKAAGITWHISKPKRHVIVFRRGDVEVLRKEPLALCEPKELALTLSELWSIASGKSANARQIELDRKKNDAQAAREEENQLQQIAAKHTEFSDQEQEQQGEQ